MIQMFIGSLAIILAVTLACVKISQVTGRNRSEPVGPTQLSLGKDGAVETELRIRREKHAVVVFTKTPAAIHTDDKGNYYYTFFEPQPRFYTNGHDTTNSTRSGVFSGPPVVRE